jgi:hypothetical protein
MMMSCLYLVTKGLVLIENILFPGAGVPVQTDGVCMQVPQIDDVL